MSSVLSKLHWFIILYAVYSLYEGNELHQDKLKMVQEKIPVIKKKIKKKLQEKKDLEKYYEDIEEAKTNIEKVALEIEKLHQQLPSKISDTENLGLIIRVAESINLKKVRTEPGDQVTKGFYVEKRYYLKAEGTFLQFLVFFEKLGKSSRLFNVAAVEMENVNKEQRGRFQVIEGKVTVVAYRYNASYREDRGIKDIEQKFKGAKRKKDVGKKK